jgi:hypothetical protein
LIHAALPIKMVDGAFPFRRIGMDGGRDWQGDSFWSAGAELS